MVEFQQNVIFPAIFLHAECSSTIPSLSKSAAAIRTCGEHPNGITINYVTVSSICNRARCVIGSRRAAVGGRARRRTQLSRTFESVQKVIYILLTCSRHRNPQSFQILLLTDLPICSTLKNELQNWRK